MLSVSSAAIGYAPVTAPVRQPRADVRMETMSDLDALAQKLNPKVGFYDPCPDPDPHPSPGPGPSPSPGPSPDPHPSLSPHASPSPHPNPHT